MVKINSTSGLADMNQLYWDSTLVASLVNIGGKLRLAERSTRLCDRLTQWHTDKNDYNLSNAANALLTDN